MTRADHIRQWMIRIIAVVGIGLSGTLLGLTFGVPEFVEKLGADFIETQISQRFDGYIDNWTPPTDGGRIAQFANQLLENNQQKVAALRQKLKNKLHETMAASLAEIRDVDCACRQKYSQWLERGFTFEIAALQAANDKLVEFVQGRYMQTTAELKLDIRIFAGSNLAIFCALLLVSLLKPKAVNHLFVPAILLALATVTCSYFYLFEQNWLLTIIYNDYLGFAYLAYIGVVFALLCDIVLNCGRVTTEILNAITNVVGSAVSFTPC